MRDLRQVAGLPYWRENDAAVVVEAWRRSGLPVAAFGRAHGIAPVRLRRWVARLRARATHPSALPRDTEVVRFHAIEMIGGSAQGRDATPPARPGWVAELVLGDGLCVRVPVGFDGGELERLLDMLRPC